MAVHVVIKRKMKSDHPEELVPLLAELRVAAKNQPGYLDGRTLRNVDSPDEYLVISKWETAEDWQRWLASQERRDIQHKVDSLMGERTFYDVYEQLSH